MKVFDFPQRSPEWFNARRGVFTASEIGKFVTAIKPTAAQEKARVNLIYKKLSEISGAFMSPIFETEAMRRGTELEAEARKSYAVENGVEVKEVGFCIHDSGAFGCSPDGIIEAGNGLVEIKCPEGQTHIRYIFEQKLPAEYEMQVHMQMATTGADWCDFYSYCPGLPPFQFREKCNTFTGELERGLIRLHKDFLEYQERLAEIWDAEMKKEQGAA